MTTEVTEILKNLSQIGVNISDSQIEFLKWRLSDEGKQYYSIKETNNFYEAVEKGDVDYMATEMRERQNKINALKKSLGLVSILIVALSLFTGCMIPRQLPDLNEQTLKETEKIYPIKNSKIEDTSGTNSVGLDGVWFVVHKDFIKEHYQNQNDLISTLENVKDLRNQLFVKDKESSVAIQNNAESVKHLSTLLIIMASISALLLIAVIVLLIVFKIKSK